MQAYSDLKSLISKLKTSVEYRTKVELATALNASDSNAVALTLADAKVEAAEASIMATIRSALKTGNGKMD